MRRPNSDGDLRANGAPAYTSGLSDALLERAKDRSFMLVVLCRFEERGAPCFAAA